MYPKTSALSTNMQSKNIGAGVFVLFFLGGGGGFGKTISANSFP